ncbi:hypothetical protein CKM354_000035400 [Cercospora kikuchii]|uniref:Methyltransferase domain-containing protein n=1 Tax=Cercospora kikuchii TaxID=84275 RepID=A0A9P3F7P4_9PEZI|nr:uncharacterized protein CKM354_000035400 [Cercospora kikuchii]GIZ36888.1 hypothetical protein CKM354_000035400 [Cercospora kikuchii]
MSLAERAMSFHYNDEKHPLGEWHFEALPSPPTSDEYDRTNRRRLAEYPPRWDSFRNRIMTDEQAAQKVRDDAAAAAAKQRRKTRWNSKYYSKDLTHVSGLAGPVIDLMNPQPTDTILDIGCGDGSVTIALANKVPNGLVVGLDDASATIEHANYKSPYGNLTFVEHDLSKLEQTPGYLIRWEGAWDWVFSKSTLHRLLRIPENRTILFENVYRLLKPGGKLVFECGAAGTVPEAITALTAAMAIYGVSSDERRDANPWFCPSAEWMREALEAVGFDVLECRTHHEPSKVSRHDGSLEGWVRKLGREFLDVIEPVEGERRDEIVKWVCDVLNDSIERKEDGTRWLSYVKLRVVARKKKTDTPNVIRRMCEAGALLPGRMSNRGTSFSFI